MSIYYYRLCYLIDNGDIEIDTIVASSRSLSTTICQALVTISDYDMYFHEPLRIECKAELNSPDAVIDGQKVQQYDACKHILSFYDGKPADYANT